MSDINILVCDDDKEIAGAIEIYLRNEGYNVFKAFDGVQALDIARRQELHLIIMDVMMPNMDGVQATMKIRLTIKCQQKNDKNGKSEMNLENCMTNRASFDALNEKVQNNQIALGV